MAFTKLGNEMIRPGFIDAQFAKDKARRTDKKGKERELVYSDEYQKGGMRRGLAGLGLGAGVGALSAGLATGSGAGAGLGAYAGGLLGGVGGAMHNDKEYLKEKGIESKLLGLKTKMTPEAAEQYLEKE